jgi:hypothetical protein
VHYVVKAHTGIMIVENQLAQSGTVDAAAGINYAFAKLVNDQPQSVYLLEAWQSRGFAWDKGGEVDKDPLTLERHSSII